MSDLGPRSGPSPLVAVAEGSLEDAALALAASEPSDVDSEAVRRQLDDLAHAVRMPPSASPFEGIARLSIHLFQTFGLRGDEADYDAPHNSWINKVLERRLGLPILLSVVTIAVAERTGLVLEPIGFPGHFLVAPRDAEDRFFVDPFHGGAIVTEDQLRARFARQTGIVDDPDPFEAAVAPVSTHAVLVRMCTNLSLSYLRRHDRAGAARMRAHLEGLGQLDGPVIDLLRRFLD